VNKNESTRVHGDEQIIWPAFDLFVSVSSDRQRMDFFEYLCAQRILLILLHGGGWVGIVLNSISLVFTSPGGTVVVIMNYVGLFVLIGWTGFVLWKCHQINPASSPIERETVTEGE
jgi:hypothetical protein